MHVIDGDSHFMEPLDLYPRYIDPAFRERAMRVEKDPTGGVPLYRKIFADVAAKGYEGFELR